MLLDLYVLEDHTAISVGLKTRHAAVRGEYILLVTCLVASIQRNTQHKGASGQGLVAAFSNVRRFEFAIGSEYWQYDATNARMPANHPAAQPAIGPCMRYLESSGTGLRVIDESWLGDKTCRVHLD